MSSRRFQDVSIKTKIFVLVIRLQDVFKIFSRCYQDVFKTSSRRLTKTSPNPLQDVFKTSCKNVFKTSSRSLQDVLKTYHQVKLFLLTWSQDVFETYSKRFSDVTQRRLSTEGFVLVTLLRNIRSVYNICKVTKVSQILVSHFTTPFSSCLQRRRAWNIELNLVQSLQIKPKKYSARKYVWHCSLKGESHGGTVNRTSV